MTDQKFKQKFCYSLRLFPEFYDLSSWPQSASDTVSVHFQYLRQLTEDGVVILAGRTVNDPMNEDDFGICILEANSREEAQKIMDNDPAVKGKVMYSKLYDFSLALLRK